MVAGGVESDLLRAERSQHAHAAPTRGCCEHKPEIYWPMLQTAETVAKRYNIAAEAQDEYGAAAASSAPPRRRRRASSTTRSCR